MVFKYLLICFSLLKLINCDKSFAIVLDTSDSMADELNVIKANIDSASDYSDSLVRDYVLVPFSDPVVANTTVTTSFFELVTAVNRVSLTGGRDCPEVALAGLEKALTVSKPRSNIFLFTDAFPKDIHKLSSIENLCRNTLSQVVIFLTGFCANSALVQAYYDVAKACSGTVFQLNSVDLRQVFKYMKEVTKMDSNNIITYESFDNYKEISFSVDSFTKSIILTVSGKNLTVELSRVDNVHFTKENILKSSHAQVLRLTEDTAGEYTIKIRCQGKCFFTGYKKFQLPLQMGFSTEQPRSMAETSARPMPGRENYIFIDVLKTIKLEAIAIEVYNEPNKRTLSLQETITNLYLAKTFIDPDKSFRIWIYGHDKVTASNVTGYTETVIPQLTVLDPKWIDPKSEILEGTSVTINYGNEATLACKIMGYPKPSVWWETDESTVITHTNTVLLEVPSLYISYLNIENVTTNFTASCKCRNTKGEDSKTIEVFVHRPFTFEVLKIPQDESIEYGSEGQLFCQVSAYPEAEIKWFHNNSIVTETDDITVLAEDNTVLIKNMCLDYAGDWKCVVSNTVRTEAYTAYVTVSGLEPPEVETESNMMLRLGDESSLECRIIKGKPTPVITWEFKPKEGFEFSMLPDSTTVDEGKLNIASAQTEHIGVFRCYASNLQGRHYADIAVNVQYPPIIVNGETSELIVNEDDNVVLECAVTASPAANVWWEASRNEALFALDQRHHTDESHVHRFKALDKDSGDYHCIAENILGKAKKTITVNVRVKPLIIASPESRRIIVRAGSSIDLPCNVTFGNPIPSTKWLFIAKDSSSHVLHRGHSSLPLHINDVRHSDEGSYICIAENIVGKDSINIEIKVQ